MTKVKATALKQPFLALLEKIVQNNNQVQFNVRTISKSLGDRSDNNVLQPLKYKLVFVMNNIVIFL